MKYSLKPALSYGMCVVLSLLLVLQSYGKTKPNGVLQRGYPPVRVMHYRPVFPFYYNWGYPRIGLSINFLPFGYMPIYFGASLYYYFGGVYYVPTHHGYQVAVPPLGAEIPQLPPDARPVMVNSQQYFELNGVYYQPITKPDGRQSYIIAGKDGVLNTAAPAAPQPAVKAPQVGDILNQLPAGCKTVNLGGKVYYVSADGSIYYEQATDNNGTYYRISGISAANPAQ